MNEQSYSPEIVLDCRKLQEQCQNKEHSICLTTRVQRGYQHRHGMIGWSYVFVAVGTCFLIGGGVMLVLSLTIEVHMESLADHYNMHTTVQGAAIVCLGTAFILAAFIKAYYNGHA
ncbi:hypothetical protein MRX96_056175 [Rhipicephalus microplus]